MNSICPRATKQQHTKLVRKKCKIEFLILDGADHGEECPQCGAAPNADEENEQEQLAEQTSC